MPARGSAHVGGMLCFEAAPGTRLGGRSIGTPLRGTSLVYLDRSGDIEVDAYGSPKLAALLRGRNHARWRLHPLEQGRSGRLVGTAVECVEPPAPPAARADAKPPSLGQ